MEIWEFWHFGKIWENFGIFGIFWEFDKIWEFWKKFIFYSNSGFSLYEANIKEHFNDIVRDCNKYLTVCDIEYFSMENIEDDKLLR